MAKSLKKYKRPPRSAREPAEEAQTTPAQRKATKATRALGVAPKTAPVKCSVGETRVPPLQKHAPSDDESEGPVDSGTEEIDDIFTLPSAAMLLKKDAAKVAALIASTTREPFVDDEGPSIPPATQAFMVKWLPKWHAYCSQFPRAENFAGVAPYCSAGMDLVLAFTRDVTASHISKKGLPFDTSAPNASPWVVQFNNVFYPADKIRNFIDINVRRFEKFRDGEEMEGRMWMNMDGRYQKAVDGLLEKMERFKMAGAWERESKRVNEMVKYGVFGKVEGDGQGEAAKRSED